MSARQKHNGYGQRSNNKKQLGKKRGILKPSRAFVATNKGNKYIDKLWMAEPAEKKKLTCEVEKLILFESQNTMTFK